MNCSALRATLTCLLCLASLTGLPGAASAQWGASPRSEAGDARARELYLRGDRLYNEGRYEDAVTAFLESYQLSGRPLLLFNLANAYERLGRYEYALDALRRYAPNAPASEEGQVRARIENLTRRAEEQRAAEPGASPPPVAGDPNATATAPATPSRGGGGDPALIGAGAAVLGLGAVLVVGGAIFGVLSLDAGAQVADQCREAEGGRFCLAEAAGPLSDEATFAALADVGLFVGGAALAGGAVLLIVGLVQGGGGTAAAGLSPRLAVSTTGAEVGLGGAF